MLIQSRQLIKMSGFWWFMVYGILTPLSTIFQLYRESVLLMEENGVPGENY
jgi:hypothetical protein